MSFVIGRMQCLGAGRSTVLAPARVSQPRSQQIVLSTFTGFRSSLQLAPSKSSSSTKVQRRASRCRSVNRRVETKMMFERFTEKAIKVVMLAQEEARRLGHNFVGTEQILLGLIGESTGIAAKVLDF